MGTLRAKTLRYPGSHGLNTIEETVVDENTRYGVVVTNGVVDSGGKLAARKEFTLQTTGFSNTTRVLWAHRSLNSVETIWSAADGQIYTGITTLTSRYDYRAGFQVVDVGGAKTSASSTGLANSTETYGLTVSVNGAAAQQVNVTGSSAQTYANLLVAINADLTGASCSLVGGNLRFISASNGVGSTISVLNSLGSASNLLLSTLSNFTAIRAANAGVSSAENWQFASFRGRVYAAQRAQYFTALDESNFTVASVVGQPWSNSVNCVIAAYGRLWAADDQEGGSRQTVWWSNLLDGLTWNSGDAGSLDVSNAWPKGQDTIIAIAAAFSRLFIFGRRSILLYTLPASNAPTGMTLTDVVENIGCVARDSVQVTDTGIYFLSDNGIYRIDKLAQTTALMTLPQVSYLYNEEVLAQIAAETATNIRSGYYPTEGYYALSFPTSNVTFVVMTRKVTPADGNRLVGLKWTNTGRPFYAFIFDENANWYSGGVNGIHRYTGYTPDGTSNAYSLTYTALWNPIEDESRLKHGKAITLVLEAASGQTGTLEWKHDYVSGTVNSNAFTCSTSEFAENPGIGHVSISIGGSFKVIQPSVIFPINGNAVTLHQMRIYASPGAVKQG